MRARVTMRIWNVERWIGGEGMSYSLGGRFIPPKGGTPNVRRRNPLGSREIKVNQGKSRLLEIYDAGLAAAFAPLRKRRGPSTSLGTFGSGALQERKRGRTQFFFPE